jgi:predicted phosphodiesterase
MPWSSRTTGWVGPGRIGVEAGIARSGRTTVEVPPLGRLSVGTPAGAPVHLRARVEEIDLEKTQELATSADPAGDLDTEGRDDLAALLRRMGVRTAIVSAVVGALAGFLLPRRRWWFAPLGVAGALLSLAALGTLTWQRFDLDAFEQPRFEGALERAPAIIEAARSHVDDLPAVQDRVRVLGQQLADLYSATSAVDVGAGAAGETRILHVSDLHSNPLGLEFVRRVAENFEVDAVLDTGDLTSFGYPLEARIGELVTEVPVRYLFVPGNHDSLANRIAIDEFPNVELLDGSRTVRVGAVRVLGVPDPTFTATNEVSTDDANAAKEDAAADVRRTLRRLDPDLLAVHDVRQAAEVEGDVPVVVAGHTHRRRERQAAGTRFLTVGSAGAGGLGTFTVGEEGDGAYEARILHYRGRRLVALTYLTLQGISGDLSIERDAVDVTPDP